MGTNLFNNDNNLVEQVQENTIRFNAFLNESVYNSESDLPAGKKSGSTALVFSKTENNKNYYDLFKYSLDQGKWIKIAENVLSIKSVSGSSKLKIPEYTTTDEWNNRANKQVGDIGWLLGATPDENAILLHTSLGDKQFKDWDQIKSYIDSSSVNSGYVEKDIQTIRTITVVGDDVKTFDFSAYDGKDVKVFNNLPGGGETYYSGKIGPWGSNWGTTQFINKIWRSDKDHAEGQIIAESVTDFSSGKFVVDFFPLYRNNDGTLTPATTQQVDISKVEIDIIETTTVLVKQTHSQTQGGIS